MPTTTSLIELRIPEAEYLADLYGIQMDLENAALLCKRAITFERPEGDSAYIVEAIVVAALVKYCRCFGTGVRNGLSPDDLTYLTAELREVHIFLSHLRDKFVAHSVNPFEETYVNAAVRERDGIFLPVQHLSAGQTRVILSAHEASMLTRLIDAVATIVAQRILAEEQQLLPIVQAQPVETIYRLGLHSPKRLNDGDAAKARKRLGRKIRNRRK